MTEHTLDPIRCSIVLNFDSHDSLDTALSRLSDYTPDRVGVRRDGMEWMSFDVFSGLDRASSDSVFGMQNTRLYSILDIVGRDLGGVVCDAWLSVTSGFVGDSGAIEFPDCLWQRLAVAGAGYSHDLGIYDERCLPRSEYDGFEIRVDSGDRMLAMAVVRVSSWRRCISPFLVALFAQIGSDDVWEGTTLSVLSTPASGQGGFVLEAAVVRDIARLECRVRAELRGLA